VLFLCVSNESDVRSKIRAPFAHGGKGKKPSMRLGKRKGRRKLPLLLMQRKQNTGVSFQWRAWQNKKVQNVIRWERKRLSNGRMAKGGKVRGKGRGACIYFSLSNGITMMFRIPGKKKETKVAKHFWEGEAEAGRDKRKNPLWKIFSYLLLRVLRRKKEKQKGDPHSRSQRSGERDFTTF